MKGIDPNTGFNVGDARCYVDATPNLSATDKKKVFEYNALKVCSRLKARSRSGSAATRSGRSRIGRPCPQRTDTGANKPRYTVGIGGRVYRGSGVMHTLGRRSVHHCGEHARSGTNELFGI